jgi:hypothetical protein
VQISALCAIWALPSGHELANGRQIEKQLQDPGGVLLKHSVELLVAGGHGCCTGARRVRPGSRAA